MWQALSAHGVQTFATNAEIAARAQELEHALSELCLTISRETGDVSTSGLERARALRSRPDVGGKSHYECINQLIHYWYCCAAAKHLLRKGFTSLTMRPTGHDNATDLGDDERTSGPYDLEARHYRLGTLAGEVFCVSGALWPQKMAKTRAKLASSSASVRAVFYNVEAKPNYSPQMERLVVFGIESPSGTVREIASTIVK
jgi:hypothetical protein